jgi:hypothetical protein
MVLLEHGVSVVESRFSGKMKSSNAIFSFEAFFETYRSFCQMSRLELLEDLSEEMRGRFASSAEPLLWAEDNPVVKAKIIQVFGGRWPSDEYNALFALLETDHFCLCMAVFETIILHAKELIEKVFPRVMCSGEPRLTLSAVKSLAKSNPQKAQAYLESLLSSSLREVRIMGICFCDRFPLEEVRPMFLKMLATESDEKVLKVIERLLKSNSQKDFFHQLCSQSISAEENNRLCSEKMDDVNSPIDRKPRKDSRGSLATTNLVKSPGKMSPETLAALLGKARQDLSSEFIDLARSSLKSRNGMLVASSIEYLGTFDLDWVSLYLKSFLESSDPRVVTAALSAYHKIDRNEALLAFKSILLSKNRDTQRAATAVMTQFEFSSIRNLLSDFLAVQSDSEVILSCLELFKSNPEPENLPILLALENKCNGKNKSLVHGIRLEVSEILIKSGCVSLMDIERLERGDLPLLEQKRCENSRKATKPPTRDRSRNSPPSIQEKSRILNSEPAKDLGSWGTFPVKRISIGLAILVLVIWGAFSTRKTAPAPTRRLVEVFSQAPMTISGILEKRDRYEVRIRCEANQVFVVEKKRGIFPPIPWGTKITMDVIPSHVSSDGVQFALLYRMPD